MRPLSKAESAFLKQLIREVEETIAEDRTNRTELTGARDFLARIYDENVLRSENQRAKLGRELYRLRKLNGLTQQQLSEKSKVSVPTIRSIEKNYTTHRHYPDTLTSLSRAFGLADDFFASYHSCYL